MASPASNCSRRCARRSSARGGGGGGGPTEGGAPTYTNLDNGASTPTFGPIWEAVCRLWRQPPEIRDGVVQDVAAQCAAFLGAPLARYHLFFTANTTEALHLAAQNVLGAAGAGAETVVVNTLLEHHSNELPWRYLPGVSLVRLPVDDAGFIDMAALERCLREHNVEGAHGDRRVRLVALCGASNVLGTFNDLRAAGEIAHRRISMEDEGIDYLAFSGHKVYAPFGSGALVVRRDLWNLDAEETARVRASGEENVAGVVALGKALHLLERIGLDVVEAEERRMTRRLLEGLSQIPGTVLYGIADPDAEAFERRGGVVTFNLEHVPHNLLAQRLAERGGIGVRNGCFCAHLLVKHLLRIHPLRALAAEVGLKVLPDFTASVLPGMVRASLGLENDAADVDLFLDVVAEVAREPRRFYERWLGGTRNATPLLPRAEVRAEMDEFVEAVVARVYGAVRLPAPP